VEKKLMRRGVIVAVLAACVGQVLFVSTVEAGPFQKLRYRRQGRTQCQQCSQAGGTAAAEQAISLFNGEDLAGWDGDPRLWSVRDGVIHGETTAEQPTKGNTFLIYTGEGEEPATFENFELALSFRCNATNNSGIQYRSERLEKAPNKWVVAGYQHEVRNEKDFPNVSAFIYDERGKAGRLCNIGEHCTRSEDGKKTVHGMLIDEPAFQKLFQLDDWNDVVIRAEGKRIRHYLNGKQVIDFTNDDPATVRTSGVIALQLHGGKPMWAEFRDVRIKELP
jgi:hypothetical protein